MSTSKQKIGCYQDSSATCRCLYFPYCNLIHLYLSFGKKIPQTRCHFGFSKHSCLVHRYMMRFPGADQLPAASPFALVSTFSNFWRYQFTSYLHQLYNWMEFWFYFSTGSSFNARQTHHFGTVVTSLFPVIPQLQTFPHEEPLISEAIITFPICCSLDLKLYFVKRKTRGLRSTNCRRERQLKNESLKSIIPDISIRKNTGRTVKDYRSLVSLQRYGTSSQRHQDSKLGISLDIEDSQNV